jgi:hypothetical protein
VAIITGKGSIEGRGTFDRDPALKLFRSFEIVEGGRTVLWQDSAGSVAPVVMVADPVGAVRDYRNGALLAVQSSNDLRPLWQGSGNGIRFDRIDDTLRLQFDADFDGYLVVGTTTASYVLRVFIPAGNYDYGRWELFDVVALEFYDSVWGVPYADGSLARVVRRGAAPVSGFGSVTNLFSAWKDRTEIVEFPLLSFTGMLTGEVDSESAGFKDAWRGCTRLTTFPAGSFNGCASINFSGAFVDCALTEQSVDNILVSVESNGTSNGRIDITGGTNQAPGSAGRAAQIALQSRGWTVNVAATVSGVATASATSSIVAGGGEVAPLMPLIEEAFSYLDAYKLLSEGFRTDDAVETWANALALSGGDAVQLTVAARASFQTDANGSGLPGLLFDGTDDHYELGNAWKLPKQGPWTMYFALRRNSTNTRSIATWQNASGTNNTPYALNFVSASRTNHTYNAIFSGNILENVGTDPVYSFAQNQRRLLTITKREDDGYSVFIDNLLLFQTDTDGVATIPAVQPLLGARWNSTGTAKETFTQSTIMGVLGYNAAHDVSKRAAVSEYAFDRYAITPPYVEDRNTNIATVLSSNARGNWINADTGSTAIDLSTYGKNGTYENGVSLQQSPLAKDGESASFSSASNQYISNIGVVGDYNFMRSTHQWSFGAWVRPTGTETNYQLLLSTTNAIQNVGVWIGIDRTNTNRQLRVDLCGPAGQQQTILSFSALWLSNRTNFITVTSDGSNIRFYKDAQLWGTTAITASATDDDHDQPLSLCGPQQGYFNGSMQLAFLTNKALTRKEISDIYASTRLDL